MPNVFRARVRAAEWRKGIVEIVQRD